MKQSSTHIHRRRFLSLTLEVVDELSLELLAIILSDQDPPGVVANTADNNEAGDLLGDNALGLEMLGLEVHDLLGAVLPSLAEVIVVEIGELAEAGATADVAEEAVVELHGLPVQDSLLLRGRQAAAGLVLNVQQDVAVLVRALADVQSHVRHGDHLAGQPVHALHLEDVGGGLGEVIVLGFLLVYGSWVIDVGVWGCLTVVQEPLRSWMVLEAGAAIVLMWEWFCGYVGRDEW